MDLNYIFILMGMNTLIVFLFKREWLIEKAPFLTLLTINVILFIMAYILTPMNRDNSNLIIALKMPLLSQILFTCFVFFFKKIYKRNPVDTFWVMDKDLMKDGIFNFFFWVLGIILPTILVFTKII